MTGGSTRDKHGALFIDRNPDGFAMILEFLRTGRVFKPPHWSDEQAGHEFDFYGIGETAAACLETGREHSGSLDGTIVAAGEAAWRAVDEHRVAWRQQALQWVEANRGSLVSALLEEMRRGQYKKDISSISPTFDLVFCYETGTRTGPPQLRLQGGKDIRIEDSCARNPLWLYYVSRILSKESKGQVVIEKGGITLRMKFGWCGSSPSATVQDVYELLESCRTSHDTHWAWDTIHLPQQQ
eukprot:m51a1_g13357 hypothetical protein (240) ;mRNA; f:427-1346